MLILRTTPAERRAQVRGCHAARRALLDRIAADRDLAAWVRRREEGALLGAASLLGGRLSRGRIRRVARRAARLLPIEKIRMESEVWEAFEIEGREHLDAAIAEGRGVVVAPVHAGPYRFIAPMLVQLGYRVLELADPLSVRHFADELQGGGLRHYVEACARDLGTTSADQLGASLRLTDSSEPAALWRLRLGLAEGAVALMFPDGNLGMEDRPPDRHCLRVPFFGQTIAVRAGIGALAGVADCAVVPAVARSRGRRPPVLRFEPAIERRRADEARAEHRQRVMATLFAHVEREVVRSPQRWEEWPHVHRWLVRESAPMPAPVRSHDEAAADLEQGDASLVLRRESLWIMQLRDRPHVVDLATWNSLGAGDALVSLVAAAEAGQTVSAWRAACSHPDAAREAWFALAGRGWVALDDDARIATAVRSPFGAPLSGRGRVAPDDDARIASALRRPFGAALSGIDGAAGASVDAGLLAGQAIAPPVVAAACAGHFPGGPLVPGAYLAAWMASAAGWGAETRGTLGRVVLRAAVRPGAVVTIEARSRDDGAQVTLLADGIEAARASLGSTSSAKSGDARDLGAPGAGTTPTGPGPSSGARASGQLTRSPATALPFLWAGASLGEPLPDPATRLQHRGAAVLLAALEARDGEVLYARGRSLPAWTWPRVLEAAAQCAGLACGLDDGLESGVVAEYRDVEICGGPTVGEIRLAASRLRRVLDFRRYRIAAWTATGDLLLTAEVTLAPAG